MRITRRSRTCVDAASRASQCHRLEHHCISNKSKSKGRWKVSRLRTKSRTKMVEWQVFGQSRTTDALEQALVLTRRLEAIVKKAPSALTIRSHCWVNLAATRPHTAKKRAGARFFMPPLEDSTFAHFSVLPSTKNPRQPCGRRSLVG